MNSPFNKSVLMWWQSLGPSTKFELLPYFEEADDYASRTVSSYLKKTSTADILWHMLNDNSGRAILARHEKLTDDILDIAFIHQDEHYWNHNCHEIMSEAFSESLVWFSKMYDPNIVPNLGDLSKVHKKYAAYNTSSIFPGTHRTLTIISIIAISIALGLVMTNPDRKDFDDFIGVRSKVTFPIVTSREKNYLMCSTYSVYSAFGIDSYLGICGNFYLVDGDGSLKKIFGAKAQNGN